MIGRLLQVELLKIRRKGQWFLTFLVPWAWQLWRS